MFFSIVLKLFKCDVSSWLTNEGIINAIKQFRCMWQAQETDYHLLAYCVFLLHWAKEEIFGEGRRRRRIKYFDVWHNWITTSLLLLLYLYHGLHFCPFCFMVLYIIVTFIKTYGGKFNASKRKYLQVLKYI